MELKETVSETVSPSQRLSNMKKYDCNYSKFDFKKHNENYINYCEVAISPTGEIFYAHPSHQQYLINILCEKNKCDIYELEKNIPEDYYYDILEWLMKETGYILVWYEFYKGKPNEAQLKSLEKLEKSGCVNFGKKEEKEWKGALNGN